MQRWPPPSLPLCPLPRIAAVPWPAAQLQDRGPLPAALLLTAVVPRHALVLCPFPLPAQGHRSLWCCQGAGITQIQRADSWWRWPATSSVTQCLCSLSPAEQGAASDPQGYSAFFGLQEVNSCRENYAKEALMGKKCQASFLKYLSCLFSAKSSSSPPSGSPASPLFHPNQDLLTQAPVHLWYDDQKRSFHSRPGFLLTREAGGVLRESKLI